MLLLPLPLNALYALGVSHAEGRVIVCTIVVPCGSVIQGALRVEVVAQGRTEEGGAVLILVLMVIRGGVQVGRDVVVLIQLGLIDGLQDVVEV
jgi:hypothetical protein